MDATHDPGTPGANLLTGTTILLRDIDPERDADHLFRQTHGDRRREATWDYLGYGPFRDRDDMRGWLARSAASADPRFRLVAGRGTDTAIGVVAFMRIRPAYRVLEIGHIWYVPSVRRTRANTETCFLMLRHAFDDLGYRRVEWKCDDRNAPSRAAAVRLGFVYEGTFRKHMIVKDRNRDTAWFALLDDDWPRVRANLSTWLANPAGVGSLTALNRVGGDS